MSKADDDALRDKIGEILAGGLETKTEPFPEDNRQFELLLTWKRHRWDDGARAALN